MVNLTTKLSPFWKNCNSRNSWWKDLFVEITGNTAENQIDVCFANKNFIIDFSNGRKQLHGFSAVKNELLSNLQISHRQMTNWFNQKFWHFFNSGRNGPRHGFGQDKKFSEIFPKWLRPSFRQDIFRVRRKSERWKQSRLEFRH